MSWQTYYNYSNRWWKLKTVICHLAGSVQVQWVTAPATRVQGKALDFRLIKHHATTRGLTTCPRVEREGTCGGSEPQPAHLRGIVMSFITLNNPLLLWAGETGGFAGREVPRNTNPDWSPVPKTSVATLCLRSAHHRFPSLWKTRSFVGLCYGLLLFDA